jgi:uncharacterized protein (UPF0335 family)
MTNIEVIDKLVPIYTEIDLLTQDAKQILADAKEAGLDAPALSKVAKAKVQQKLEDLKEKTDALSDLIDSVQSQT